MFLKQHPALFPNLKNGGNLPHSLARLRGSMRFPKALIVIGTTAVVLAGCDTSAPYSNVIDTTGRGVGFSDYAQYMRAQEELSRIRRNEAAQARNVQAPAASGPQFAQPTSQPASIGQEAVAAVRGAPSSPAPSSTQQFPVAQQDSGAPLSALSPSAPVQTASAATGVSEQQFTPQPFGAAQPDRLIERDFVPQVRVSESEMSAGGTGPNLFIYALSTQHNVGDQRYNRTNPFRWRRSETACAQYPSQDLAQEAFLAAGGPERDPNHLDPDGDGFACWWDPTPFRQAARTVRARE